MNHEVHQVEYNNTNLTYCGLDPDTVLTAAEDEYDLTEGVTCQACLDAIEAEEVE